MMVVVIIVPKKYKILEVQIENIKRLNTSYHGRITFRIFPLNSSTFTITRGETKIWDTIFILLRVGGLCLTYKTGFGLDLLHLIQSQLGTIGNTALSLIYTLYSSPLHTH
jgi:hypothetical protein